MIVSGRENLRKSENVLSSAARSVLQYFYTLLLLINGKIFGKRKVTEHKVCVVIFSTTPPETFLNLGRIQRDIIINVHRSSCTVPVILVRHQCT